MSDNRKNGDYEIGYGRPPKHTRFQKGQSGNRAGRPKGSLSLAAQVRKDAGLPVVVTINGVRKKFTRRQAASQQMTLKAAGGDMKAIDRMAALTGEDVIKNETAPDGISLTDDDARTLEEALACMRRIAEGAGDEDA